LEYALAPDAVIASRVQAQHGSVSIIDRVTRDRALQATMRPMASLFRCLLLWSVVPAGLLAQSSSPTPAPRVDSLILERTWCLGTCPAYRLAIHSSGIIRFESRNKNDAGRTESDTGGAKALAAVARELTRVRFFDLPTMEIGKAPLCRVIETDTPSISVSVFGEPTNRVVSYYMGCKGDGSRRTTTKSALARLRSLADSIDALTGASRWIRPAPCCGGR
jgi:hypothetical protein